MKNTLIFSLSLLLIISCTEVIFEEPQPAGVKGLKEMPKELHGQFTFVILNEETVLEIAGNYITNDDGKAYISDSLIVKKLGNRYVVNIQVNEGSDEKLGKWQTYVLEDKGCGFVKATSFIINSESYIPQFAAQYENQQIGEGQEKSIIIKPTAGQFNSILADDSVTVSVILERID